MHNLSEIMINVDDFYVEMIANLLIGQGQANALLEQREIFFGKEKETKLFELEINNALLKTKSEARDFLNNYSAVLYQNIANLLNYFVLQTSIFSALSTASIKEQRLQSIMLLKSIALHYYEDLVTLNNALNELFKKFSNATTSLKDKVQYFNVSFNGEAGILNMLDDNLRAVDSKIYDYITLAAVSAALTIGGTVTAITASLFPSYVYEAFVSATGWTVGVEFFTNYKLIALGVVVGGLSPAGYVASAFKLNELFDLKSKRLLEEIRLKAEVRLVLGVANNAEGLESQLKSAVINAKNMEACWYDLISYFEKMEVDLRKGTLLPELFYFDLKSGENVAKKGTCHVDNMKKVMAGVTTLKAKKDQKIGDAILETARAISH